MKSILRKRYLLFSAILFLVLVASLIGFRIDKIQNNQSVATVGNGEQVVFTIGNPAYASGSADFVCDGVADDIQLQGALNALPATGGKLVILGGTYASTALITRVMDNVTIEGMGRGTYITRNGVNPVFTAGGNNWQFKDFRTDAGSIDNGATTGWTWENITVNATYYAYRTASQGSFNVGNVTTTDLDAPTGRTATYVIAASDSTALEKAQADAQASANLAADVLTAVTAGYLNIHLSSGSFPTTGTINGVSNFRLLGSGQNITYIKPSGAISAITVSNKSCVELGNFTIDGTNRTPSGINIPGTWTTAMNFNINLHDITFQWCDLALNLKAVDQSEFTNLTFTPEALRATYYNNLGIRITDCVNLAFDKVWMTANLVEWGVEITKDAFDSQGIIFNQCGIFYMASGIVIDYGSVIYFNQTIVDQCKDYGLRVLQGTDIVATECYFSTQAGTTGTGIQLIPTNGAITGVSLIGSTVAYNDYWGLAAYDQGAVYPTKTLVSGCFFSNNGQTTDGGDILNKGGDYTTLRDNTHVDNVITKYVFVQVAADNAHAPLGTIMSGCRIPDYTKVIPNSGVVTFKDNQGYIGSGEVKTASGALVPTGTCTATTVSGTFTESPLTLKPGANTMTCTASGTINVVMPAGSTAVVTSGDSVVTDTPKTCPAGATTPVTVTTGAGADNFTITVHSNAFAWHNPEVQDILIKKIVINRTAAGGTATAEMNVGIADNGTVDTPGVEFFDSILVNNAAAIHDSYVAGGTSYGTQTIWVNCQDSVSATDGWVVGKLDTEIANSLAGSYYIEYVGK